LMEKVVGGRYTPATTETKRESKDA
jgi:hypothetical protein